MAERKTEWQIKLYKNGELIATFSYANQARQQNAALALRKWYYGEADEWWFTPQWANPKGSTLV